MVRRILYTFILQSEMNLYKKREPVHEHNTIC